MQLTGFYIMGTLVVKGLSNNYATFEAQFMRKLSNTEAELKKSVAYKKKACIC